MTKPFLQTLNQVHRNLWEKSDRGRISEGEIKKEIKKTAGYTVVDKYWEELHNFDRIEQVPGQQTWIVDQPEDSGLEFEVSGEKRAKQVLVPEDVLQGAEQYGLNISAILTEALVEELSSRKQFIKDFLGEERTEEEAEYVFKLLKDGNCYSNTGDKQELARKGRRRRQIYREVFDPERIGEEESEHIEELRQETFDLSQTLNI